MGHVTNKTLGIVLWALVTGLIIYFVLTARPAGAGQMQPNRNIAFTALQANVCSPVFSPTRGHTMVAAYVKATRDGTFKMQRRDFDGTWNDLTTDEAHTGGTEDSFKINQPTTSVRVCFTDTSNNTGTYRVEFIDGGEN